MNKSEFGVIGLGVMGKSISLNIAEKGFSISVYNRISDGEESIVSDFLSDNNFFKNITGFANLESFVASVERPRKILIMIKSGLAVDSIIEQLIPNLSEGDIIIDGGNSHFNDTQKRTNYLKNKNIHFVGCGISGGEEGARKGPSIMPGGTVEAYKEIAPILEKIAAKDSQGKPCCSHIGNDGAGHFIKMVHNGIEYAEMQLIAEVYSLLHTSLSNKEIAKIFENWNLGNESSYLLEITAKILRKQEGKNDLIDIILDKAGNKGTGSWSSKTALELGFPNTMMTSSVFDRYISSFKERRVELAQKINRKNTNESVNIEQLKKGYQFARIINHQQGFGLIKEASNFYNWDLNLSEIARIWTNGCIIRSKFMEDSISILKENEDYFEDQNNFNYLNSSEASIIKVLQFGLQNRISLNTLSASYNYWVGMTTKKLPANIIQAQRDFFGAHTYQRIDTDNSSFFHTKWQEL
ncbi:6-phosphogluconate dehydrogenase [Tenacibaculum adriaticum]|uniref:6-phosphogluconate dehydrogenase, decarboxylating n=1 Tax=Tenacibaculum adriaticum TaxID=413713 RepID=A0A5S5DS31_9FLAO|nr:NADP-dependent phosphogluconate dehydrogenase [Tenacibaculum adriaticum]TYP98188.1 6-phosphogluconate dehydrogenase [Tenacibaculum adriaticum]